MKNTAMNTGNTPAISQLYETDTKGRHKKAL